MSELDFARIAKQIRANVPEGYSVCSIRLNFDLIDQDVPERLFDRVCTQFETKAENYLSEDIEVTPDNSIPELWTYDLVHSPCGNEPMWDAQEEEHYCPTCNTSIFDY